MSDTTDEVLTSAAAARLAGVTPDTIRGWTRSGRLPSVETTTGQRLIRRTALDLYLLETRGQEVNA